MPGCAASTSRTIASSTAPRSLLEHLLAQVDEADRAVDLVRVEEGELLLVAQHLERRLAQHGEVQRGPLGGGVART